MLMQMVSLPAKKIDFDQDAASFRAIEAIDQTILGRCRMIITTSERGVPLAQEHLYKYRSGWTARTKYLRGLSVQTNQ